METHDQESAAAERDRRATGGAAGRDRKGRFSARRKRATVLRLLRGEDLESVSRELGITAARASLWRDQFLAAGRSGPPRTWCWLATSAGCLKPRRFMARGTAKPGLRVAGIRTSQERVRRLMREHDLQAPHRVGHAHGPKAHDGTITTEAPDMMWGTDMTATVTIGEGSAFVFVAVDHCTTECIGLHAAKSGSRFEALEPIRQGVRERFGGISEGVAQGLRLRHDHGSNYLADDFQQEVAFFGIESSPSFVREPEGNGVAERFIRTLKENVLWVRSFETIEELRLALLAFKRTYNKQWMLEKYDYRSPAQVRRDLVGLDAAA